MLILQELAGPLLGALLPEVRKAASYILDNPNDVGISSIREIAEAAQREAEHVRAHGPDHAVLKATRTFREPFREEIRRRRRENFPDRARWLQALGEGR